MPLSKTEEEAAIESFAKLVQFPTISALGVSNGSYVACAQYLIEQCTAAGLVNVGVVEASLPGKPIVRASWIGNDASLPCIVLNSHYDVVPAQPEDWTMPPFEGLRKDGRVYGRGTQDMKCVCVQYLAAIKHLMSAGFQPQRSVHLTFVPDEEIGGVDGMVLLLSTPWFSSLDIGLALDEGLASEDDSYSVFYGERLPWWVKVSAKGNTGHGSRFIEGTAVEQLIGEMFLVYNYSIY
jgi:aminoacylase